MNRIKNMTKKIWILAISVFLLTLSCSTPGAPDKNEGPPVITQTSVADSLQLPPSGSFRSALVRVWIDDPDGINDIDSVYFYSQKPDGSLANEGSPFVMVDNGKAFNISNPWEEAGDAVKGDGIYSLTIILNVDAQTGGYQFTFYARDKHGALSAALQDSIKVYK